MVRYSSHFGGIIIIIIIIIILFLNTPGHVERADDSRIPPKVMGGCFEENKALGKRRGRFLDSLIRYVVDLFPIRNWKAENK